MPRAIQQSKLKQRFNLIARAGVLLLVFAVALIFSTPLQCADNGNRNNFGGRKVLVRLEPEYPTDLKAAGIGGYVHLNVTISPNGAVVSSEVVGGNPILAQSAIKAVTKWKFSPAPTTTSAEIWFHFAQ